MEMYYPMDPCGDGRTQLLDRKDDGLPRIRVLRRNGGSRKTPRYSAHVEPSATRRPHWCGDRGRSSLDDARSFHSPDRAVSPVGRSHTSAPPHAEPSLRSRLPVVVAAGREVRKYEKYGSTIFHPCASIHRWVSRGAAETRRWPPCSAASPRLRVRPWEPRGAEDGSPRTVSGSGAPFRTPVLSNFLLLSSAEIELRRDVLVAHGGDQLELVLRGQRVIAQGDLHRQGLFHPPDPRGLLLQHVEGDLGVHADDQVFLLAVGPGAADGALDPAHHRFRREDAPRARAGGARLGLGVVERGAHPLARHLDQPQLAHLERLGARPVAGQVLAELLQDLFAVLL